MENKETTNAIVPVEAAAEIPKQKNNGLIYAAIIGVNIALGALAWECGVKPIGRRIKDAWCTAKENRKLKKAERDSDDETNVVDDVDYQFPIE